MVDIAFKDLCIDVTAGGGRSTLVAGFWAAALDLDVIPNTGEDFKLQPHGVAFPERVIWVNAVPEAIGGKSRVHLDLVVSKGEQARLFAAGASLIRGADAARPWDVLEDPDGVAFCAFEPSQADGRESGILQLVVDADEPSAIAQWWADRTGATLHRHPQRPFVWLEGVAGLPFPRWEFNPVPEAKTQKNRVHWDVTLIDASVDDLVATGATLIRLPATGADWWVLADPEGNEFCAFTPR